MPFADNRGVRIHYQTVGKGRPVVLHHGTGGSGPDWVDFGYVEALRNNYQLILVDARGHGSSDKPHEPAAYDLSLRASDVVSVLDDLDLPKADYFGYSLGGWTGFGLAKHAPARFNSFVLGGAHPFAESMQAFRDLMLTNREALAAGIDQVFGNFLKPAMRERLLNIAADFSAHSSTCRRHSNTRTSVFSASTRPVSNRPKTPSMPMPKLRAATQSLCLPEFLREHTENRNGHQYTKFYGRPSTWMNQFAGIGKRVKRITERTDNGGPGRTLYERPT